MKEKCKQKKKNNDSKSNKLRFKGFLMYIILIMCLKKCDFTLESNKLRFKRFLMYIILIMCLKKCDFILEFNT